MKKLLALLLLAPMAHGAADQSGRADAVFTECEYVTNTVTADSTTVYTGKGAVYGVYVNTAISAHVVVIKDGATSMMSLPASAAAGTNITLPGIRFETSLVIDPDNAATTGDITVCWKRL